MLRKITLLGLLMVEMGLAHQAFAFTIPVNAGIHEVQALEQAESGDAVYDEVYEVVDEEEDTTIGAMARINIDTNETSVSELGYGGRRNCRWVTKCDGNRCRKVRICGI